MQLTPSCPKPLWLDRFAMRAGMLLPNLQPAHASALAEQVFSEAADLPPDEAAEIYALELPPCDEGAPG